MSHDAGNCLLIAVLLGGHFSSNQYKQAHLKPIRCLISTMESACDVVTEVFSTGNE